MRFLAIWLLIAIAEIATFFWVGSQIGFGLALLIAVVTAVLGSYLVKRAGLTALSRIQQRIGEGRMPGRELTDGASILIAGAFLISPGFVTDIIGFLMLIPAVRAVIHRVITRRISTRTSLFTDRRIRVQDRSGSVGRDPSDVIIDVEEWE